jgi:hypothetical protein
MTLVLRFRDLTVPDGATIKRHGEIISSRGATWWGWIMRQDEIFPDEFIVTLSRRLEEVGPQLIYLFHTGSGEFYRASLGRIAALPGGMRIRSPEMDLTPAYMHESVCPAWFEISGIEKLEGQPDIVVESMPTLLSPSQTDCRLNSGIMIQATELRNSGATLWVIS